MPADEKPAVGAVPPESSEVSIADYRKTRTEAPEPAAAPLVEKPAKTAAASETAQPEIEEGSEADKGPEPKPKGGFQRRIDQLTKEKGTLERRIAELEASPAAPVKTTVAAAAAAAGDAKPKEANFNDYAEFIEALTRWVHRQETKQAETKTLEEQKAADETTAKQRAKEKFDSYTSAIPAFEEAHTDFRALLSDPALVLPNYIQTAIVGLKEKGVAVAYELAKEFKADPDGSTLGAILRLNETGDFEVAMLELGAFVRSVHPPTNTDTKSPTTPARPASKAPTPITPVSGAAPANEADLDKMDPAEYRRLRRAGKLR